MLRVLWKLNYPVPGAGLDEPIQRAMTIVGRPTGKNPIIDRERVSSVAPDKGD